MSMKRNDRQPLHDWREKQSIKSAICGPFMEAVELYPAEWRVMDTANQYHLYAFAELDGMKCPPLPFGIQVGARVSESASGAVQRPLDGPNVPITHAPERLGDGGR